MGFYPIAIKLRKNEYPQNEYLKFLFLETMAKKIKMRVLKVNGSFHVAVFQKKAIHDTHLLLHDEP